MRLSTWFFSASLLLLASGRVAPAWAQAPAAAAEPAALTAAGRSLTQRYLATRGTEVGLYNGAEYISYDRPTIEGHQFFRTDELQPGRVRYDGFTYENVPLQLDTHLDVLVTQSAGPAKMRLISEKVESFELNGGHRFVRLPAGQGLTATGFYEVLVEQPGQVRLLTRHGNELRSIAGKALEKVFRPSEEYWLQHRDGAYRKISGKGDVLAVLADKKPELSRYARAHQLRFGKAQRGAAIAELVAHYKTLTPGT